MVIQEAEVPPLGDELERLVRRAAWIGHGGQPDVTYTSLFLALLHGPGRLSRWAADTQAAIGPRTPAVLERWQDRGRPPDFDPARLEQARGLGDDALPPLPEDLSESTRETLDRALRLARVVGTHGPAGERHVLGVMLYDPPGHLDEYQAWRLDRTAWALRLLRFCVEHHPAEAVYWQRLHAEQLTPAYSDGLFRCLAWATALAARRSPPASAIDAELLLAGILLDGHSHGRERVASAWLLRALGGDLAPLLPGTPPAPPIAVGQHLPLAADAVAVLERAGAVGHEARDRKLHTRHVVGAFLSAEGTPAAQALLGRARAERAELARRFLAWLRAEDARVPARDRDDPEAWQRLLAGGGAARDPAATARVRQAGYDNDEAHGQDRLGIGRDVDALAAVLASREIKPPLSVGLFGDWGSGKSFFIGELERRIGELAAASCEAERQGQPSAYYGRIVQIKFNAWQYMDANLWASIATHVFDCLRAALVGEDKKRKLDRYTAQLASMKEREAELAQQAAALGSETARVDGQLEGVRAARERQQLGWVETLARIRAAAHEDVKLREPLAAAARKLGVDAAQLSLEQARVERQELRGFLAQAGTWWRLIRDSRPKAALVAFLLVEPLLALLVPVVTARLPALGTWVVGIFAPLLALATWIRARIGPITRDIDDAIRRADVAEQTMRERISIEEQKLRDEQAALGARQAALEQERAALSARKAELEAELRALSDGRSFKKVVLERAASDDYRKQLGVIATAHRDFAELARLLGDRSEEPYVERIVLYIDDIDRCAPARVVEILQAVHLLLSLELFVVVVAVDSRWLLQSLDAYYAQQFRPARGRGEWESRPQHYLEKIFQIPYALPPMTELGFGTLVDGLLARHLVVAEPSVPANGAVSSSASASAPAPASGSAPEPAAAASGHRPTLDARVEAPPPPPARAIDLNPKNLEIARHELEHLRTLAPLIPSPRAAKRFVNLYRIVRATVADDELDDFLAGRYKTTQLCLASVIGRPSLSAELFSAIFDGRVADPGALDAYLSERSAQDSRWDDLVPHFKGKGELADWHSVRRAAYSVARYSFETGRILRTRESEAD